VSNLDRATSCSPFPGQGSTDALQVELQVELPPGRVHLLGVQPLKLAAVGVEGALLDALQLEREPRPQLLRACGHMCMCERAVREETKAIPLASFITPPAPPVGWSSSSGWDAQHPCSGPALGSGPP